MRPELELAMFSDPKPNEKRHLEAFHKAEINAMGDGVVSVNTAGVVLLSDAVTRKQLEIYPGNYIKDHFSTLWEGLEVLLKGQISRFEHAVQKAGREYQVTVAPILQDSLVVGAICIFVENTELQVVARQMEAFKELTRELTAIINSTSEGLWVCDGEANILRVNVASERINNLRAEEVVGRNMRELLEEGLLDVSVTLDVIEKREVVNMLETTRGGRRIIKIGIPVFDDEDNLVRVVVSERDITETDTLQRQLEEQAAISDQFQTQMLEMQQAELVSTNVIAKSPSMVTALKHALRVSETDSSVLILGESGVGKGLIADLIHMSSLRSKKPLIKINCGAIPESLIESELFGHEKGAFTGAQTSKPGHLELADGGTLFLDEIAELPLASQVKLLRFLEDGRVTRVGGTKARTVDVRVLAATHRNLEEMVEEKAFRLDLYYRLNVIPLHVPSLRERKECILFLTRHYIDGFSAKFGVKKRLSRTALDSMIAYDWPGNVRQLMNVCERLVVMSETDVVDVKDLPVQIVGSVGEGTVPIEATTLQQALDNVERSILADAIHKYGSQQKAATALGVNQSTIARKLKKYRMV